MTRSIARIPLRAAMIVLAALAASLTPLKAEAQAVLLGSPWQAGLESSRHILAFGRYEGVRAEGIAGIAPELRPEKLYRNIPGATGAGGIFDIIAHPPAPFTPFFVSFDMDQFGRRNGMLDAADLLVSAGQYLPPGFSLLILDGGAPTPVAWKWEGWVRFGGGNFYATAAIPGTDIVPGTELYTKEQFRAYTANSILWEAPAPGNVVLGAALKGGTVNIEANGSGRQLGFADPMELRIAVMHQRQLPNGSCRVVLDGRLMNSFGNPVTPGPPAGYTWFRWAIEDSGGGAVATIPYTSMIAFDLAGVGGQLSGGQTNVSLVASSFGPGVLVSLPGPGVPALPLPNVTLATQPFMLPPEPPMPVGLQTFQSLASSLEDTITISRVDCDRPPLIVSKLANPGFIEPSGGTVDFEIRITNAATRDAVIVNSVIDNRLGDLGANCVPGVPATIAPGAGMDCRVRARVTGPPESVLTNTVTVAGGYADDGTPIQASASADLRVGVAPPSQPLPPPPPSPQPPSPLSSPSPQTAEWSAGTPNGIPMEGGHRVDNCLAWAGQCGDPAAQAFCVRKGFRKVVAWENETIDLQTQSTVTLGTGDVCSAARHPPSGCGAFKRIVCSR